MQPQRAVSLTAEVKDFAEQRFGLGEIGRSIEDSGPEVLAELFHDLQEVWNQEQELGQQQPVLGVVVDEIKPQSLNQV